MKKIKPKYLLSIICFLAIIIFSFQFTVNENGFEFGTTQVEASINDTCPCPNGEVKASGNFDWGAAWKYCDDCEREVNREASDEECNCGEVPPGEG